MQSTYVDDMLSAVFQGVLSDSGLSAGDITDICVGKTKTRVVL